MPSEPDPTSIHPTPLMQRGSWWSLNGLWEVALDDPADHPDDVMFTGEILVPFAPETERSGIHHKGYLNRCWYRREIDTQDCQPDEQLLLHFGAVDHRATVWLDGQLVGRHEGGYTPFTFDITRAMCAPGRHELAVLAIDDPLDLAKPRGKQDWEVEPHLIWYPRTTGIWQTVWMERVPRTRIAELHWSSTLNRLEVTAEVRIIGPIPEGLGLRVRLRAASRDLVDDTIGVLPNTYRLERGFRLDATGLDHLRESLLWAPENPVIVDARLQLVLPDGTVIDEVQSYTAIREVEIRAGRFLLNGKPYPLRFVLDQGYWEDSGLTPPDEAALERDVRITKAMGFNGVRKHQKIEDPRFLYWADRLGMLVWVEMPPAYQFDSVAIRRVTDEWLQVVQRDRSHPCIVAWVPFNESTGLLDLASRPDEQSWVRGLTELTRALDPSRPVVSNDGWETLGGDIIAIHDYEQDPEALVRRWNGDLSDPVTGYAAHRRLQTLDESSRDWTGGRPDRALMLTEVGGIGWLPGAPVEVEEHMADELSHDRIGQPAAWGYSTVSDVEEFRTRFCALMEALHSIPRIAGFCYTQLADTYQEINGLLTSDREPKLPIDLIATAVRGPGTSFNDPFIVRME
jgi:beta-galactosidase/beta-glucuronidase